MAGRRSNKTGSLTNAGSWLSDVAPAADSSHARRWSPRFCVCEMGRIVGGDRDELDSKGRLGFGN